MAASKFYAKSSTLWGIFIAALPDLQDTVTMIGAAEVVAPQYAPIVRMVGLAIAVIGRWTASAPLRATVKK